METTKHKSRILFPENREIAKKLKPGDRRRIAKLSGYTYRTIGEVMLGYRKLKPRVLDAIEQVLLENITEETKRQERINNLIK